MDINYKEFADTAVAYAKKNNIDLDFSEQSIQKVDNILEVYHNHLDLYDGEEGADTLWNLAVHFGIYLGETMLRMELKEKGYEWYIKDEIPILKNNTDTEISPVTKVHKRILNGAEDGLKVFCDVVFSVANGDFPTENVYRAIDVELPSRKSIENVLYQDINSFITWIQNGEEDFLILKSYDGFLQFYGINNQFVAEIRVNLADNDFRTYSIIDQNKKDLVKRVKFTTPYGQFTPTERGIISLDLLYMVVQSYYRNIKEEDLLKEIPYIETTEEMKRCMGLIE